MYFTCAGRGAGTTPRGPATGTAPRPAGGKGWGGGPASARPRCGRRVPVTRPRVRAADGSRHVPVPAYELFCRTEPLAEMAMERMLAGLSTRRYRLGVEPGGAGG